MTRLLGLPQQRSGASVEGRGDLAEAEPGHGQLGSEPVRGAASVGGRDLPSTWTERGGLPDGVLHGKAERAADSVSADLRRCQINYRGDTMP